jgi:hypothetical protein
VSTIRIDKKDFFQVAVRIGLVDIARQTRSSRLSLRRLIGNLCWRMNVGRSGRVRLPPSPSKRGFEMCVRTTRATECLLANCHSNQPLPTCLSLSLSLSHSTSNSKQKPSTRLEKRSTFTPLPSLRIAFSRSDPLLCSSTWFDPSINSKQAHKSNKRLTICSLN